MDEVIPINALFDTSGVSPNDEMEPHPRSLIETANIILGCDVMSQREFLIYGKELLQKIASSEKTTDVSLMKVEIDQDTDDLERLCALVQVVKGSHDYTGGES